MPSQGHVRSSSHPGPRTGAYDPQLKPYVLSAVQTNSHGSFNSFKGSTAYEPGYEAPSAADRSLLDDHVVYKSKKPKRQVPHWLRMTWRVISLLLSVTVVGISAWAVYVRENTRGQIFVNKNTTQAPIWPKTLLMGSTYLMLAAGAYTIFINLIALILVSPEIPHPIPYYLEAVRLRFLGIEGGIKANRKVGKKQTSCTPSTMVRYTHKLPLLCGLDRSRSILQVLRSQEESKLGSVCLDLYAKRNGI